MGGELENAEAQIVHTGGTWTAHGDDTQLQHTCMDGFFSTPHLEDPGRLERTDKGEKLFSQTSMGGTSFPDLEGHGKARKGMLYPPSNAHTGLQNYLSYLELCLTLLLREFCPCCSLEWYFGHRIQMHFHLPEATESFV